jgi:hypothetical protein
MNYFYIIYIFGCGERSSYWFYNYAISIFIHFEFFFSTSEQKKLKKVLHVEYTVTIYINMR